MIRKLLRKVLQLTKENKLTWEQTGPGAYRATHEAIWLEIELDAVSRQQGTGAHDVAKIHMEAMDLTFYEGTEGMNMIRKILRQAFPHWKERINHSKDRLRQHIDALAAIV